MNGTLCPSRSKSCCQIRNRENRDRAMKNDRPLVRRKFKSAWDQIGYLQDKLLYWLYQREDARTARFFAKRLESLLSRADPKQEAILGQECRSLIFESRGNFPQAIAH